MPGLKFASRNILWNILLMGLYYSSLRLTWWLLPIFML
jgi:hypothetical protein